MPLSEGSPCHASVGLGGVAVGLVHLGDGGLVDDSFGLAFSRHRAVWLDVAVAALFGCWLRSAPCDHVCLFFLGGGWIGYPQIR